MRNLLSNTKTNSREKMGQLTYGSLFAGVGGFDLGFDKAGWEC
jgi:hypothetical protein